MTPQEKANLEQLAAIDPVAIQRRLREVVKVSQQMGIGAAGRPDNDREQNELNKQLGQHRRACAILAAVKLLTNAGVTVP